MFIIYRCIEVENEKIKYVIDKSPYTGGDRAGWIRWSHITVSMVSHQQNQTSISNQTGRQI